jgi:hypothetical protein
MDTRFSWQAIAELNPEAREALLRDLEREIGRKIIPEQFDRSVERLIEELSLLGHRLYSFDEVFDSFSIWRPDWTGSKRTDPGLIVRFSREGIMVAWSLGSAKE